MGLLLICFILFVFFADIMNVLNELNGMTKEKIISIYMELYEKFRMMHPLDGMSSDVMAIVLSYVKPHDLCRFFRTYGLDYGMSFKLDLFEKYKEYEEDEMDVKFILGLLDTFPNAEIVGLKIVDSFFDVEFPDRLYGVSRLSIVCRCRNRFYDAMNSYECWMNEDNNVFFENFVNLRCLSIACFYTNNLDVLRKCVGLEEIEICVPHCCDYDLLKDMIGLSRVALIECNMTDIVDLLSECKKLERVVLRCDYNHIFEMNVWKCDRLKYLNIFVPYNLSVSDGFFDFRGCSRLRKFSLQGGDGRVKVGKSLRELRLDDCKISNLEMVRGLMELRSFGAFNCHILKNVDDLKSCVCMRRVYFNNCKQLDLKSVNSLKCRVDVVE